MVTVIGVLLIIMGIFLVISVLMQSSKNHRVSGSIAGGAETFFGKQKGKTLDAMFNKLTTIITIIFVILVLVLCFILPTSEEARINEFVKAYEDEGYDITKEDVYITEEGIIDFVDYEAFVEKNPQLLVADTEETTDETTTDETTTDETTTDETTTDETTEDVTDETTEEVTDETTEDVTDETTEEVTDETTEEVTEETTEEVTEETTEEVNE